MRGPLGTSCWRPTSSSCWTDTLQLDTAALAGRSDSACTALVLAISAPERTAGVYSFACTMHPSGAKQPIDDTPALARCFHRHSEDYARLSPTPGPFREFVETVGLMQRTQPNASEYELAAIRMPVYMVHSEHDEFIKREHAEYLARTIPGAQLIVLPDVSHFAGLQRPTLLNATLLNFLSQTPGA